MNTALEVKEDGQIWLIPDCPEEPKYMSVDEKEAYLNSVEGFEDAEAGLHGRVNLPINKSLYHYQTELASAERILVSNQEKAARMIVTCMKFENPMKYRGSYAVGIRPGIYPIPDLKWEPRTVEKFYESKGWFWEKVAVISLPLESTPSTEQQPFNGCSPTACGCKSLADCPNNQPLAVVTFVKKEDEKNGMYEESQEELWKEVAHIVDYTPDHFVSLMYEQLQKKFTITRNPQVK